MNLTGALEELIRMAIAFDLLKGERLFKAGKKRTGVTDE